MLCLSGGTPRCAPRLGFLRASWLVLYSVQPTAHFANEPGRVESTGPINGRTDESQQSAQGDKVGAKARGRVADATVATTATPVGDTTRETLGSTRRRNGDFAFFLGAGRTGLGLPPNHFPLVAVEGMPCDLESHLSPAHVPALFPHFTFGL